MVLKNLKLSQFTNPQRWRLIKETSGPAQLVWQIGHLNPENNPDSINCQANKVLKQERRGNVIETTTTVGVSTKKGSLSDYYQALIFASQTGLLPGFSVAKIEKMRKDINQVFPEDCDFRADITLAQLADSKTASQMLTNYVLQFTQNASQNIVPGTNQTLEEIFKNPLVIAAAQKQGVGREKLTEALTKFREASGELATKAAQAGIIYKIEKFHQFEAAYAYRSVAKKKIKPKKTNRVIEIKRPDGSVQRIMASGGTDPRVKLPPEVHFKETFPIGGKVLEAIQVKNFFITGSFIETMNYLPSGKSFCQSLTKFKTKTQTYHEGEMTFIDHSIIPISSNLEEEGYLNREEVEAITLKLTTLL